MFTGKCNQGAKNSCGAATLAIAAHELKSGATPDDTAVNNLYKTTADVAMSKNMGITDPNLLLSSPANIISTATHIGFKPSLLLTKDVDEGKLNPKVKGFKTAYIDSQKPMVVANGDLFKLLSAKSFLQLLVYVNNDQLQTHWLLLQSDGTNYGLYDTAFGVNKTLTKEEVEKLLTFDAPIVTGDSSHTRNNNFFGVAISLQ